MGYVFPFLRKGKLTQVSISFLNLTKGTIVLDVFLDVQQTVCCNHMLFNVQQNMWPITPDAANRAFWGCNFNAH
jgi:hypothetical protein